MALWRVFKHCIKNTNAVFVSVFAFFTSGGNELRDVELYAFNEEAKYLLGLPLC